MLPLVIANAENHLEELIRLASMEIRNESDIASILRLYRDASQAGSLPIVIPVMKTHAAITTTQLVKFLSALLHADPRITICGIACILDADRAPPYTARIIKETPLSSDELIVHAYHEADGDDVLSLLSLLVAVSCTCFIAPYHAWRIPSSSLISAEDPSFAGIRTLSIGDFYPLPLLSSVLPRLHELVLARVTLRSLDHGRIIWPRNLRTLGLGMDHSEPELWLRTIESIHAFAQVSELRSVWLRSTFGGPVDWCKCEDMKQDLMATVSSIAPLLHSFQCDAIPWLMVPTEQWPEVGAKLVRSDSTAVFYVDLMAHALVDVPTLASAMKPLPSFYNLHLTAPYVPLGPTCEFLGRLAYQVLPDIMLNHSPVYWRRYCSSLDESTGVQHLMSRSSSISCRMQSAREQREQFVAILQARVSAFLAAVSPGLGPMLDDPTAHFTPRSDPLVLHERNAEQVYTVARDFASVIDNHLRPLLPLLSNPVLLAQWRELMASPYAWSDSALTQKGYEEWVTKASGWFETNARQFDMSVLVYIARSDPNDSCAVRGYFNPHTAFYADLCDALDQLNGIIAQCLYWVADHAASRTLRLLPSTPMLDSVRAIRKALTASPYEEVDVSLKLVPSLPLRSYDRSAAAVRTSGYFHSGVPNKLKTPSSSS